MISRIFPLQAASGIREREFLDIRKRIGINMENIKLDRIEDALEDFRQGKFVMVVDDDTARTRVTS